MSQRIGFIGLGNLGAPMARNLLDAGFGLTIHDRDVERGIGLRDAGAVWAESPAAAAQDAEVLITCLPHPSVSRAVLTGEKGGLAALPSGATWIEMSTVSRDDIISLADNAANHGISVLECPVTGGVHRAATGEMAMLVGGEAEVLRANRPVLEAMVAKIIHMGPLGSASTIKVISNLLCAIDLVAAGEALLLAQAGGIELDKAYEAICASSGSSVEFEDWAPVLLTGSLNTGFTLDLALKDLGFVQQLGQGSGLPLALTDLVAKLFEEARSTYGGQAWTPHVVRRMEEESGRSLKTDGFSEVISDS